MSVLREVAARYGGASTPRGSHMTANLGACELAVETWAATAMTRWTLHVPTAYPELTVRRRSVFDALVAAPTIELDDEEFDAHFVVTGADPHAVRSMLRRGDAMTRLLDSFSTSILTSKQQMLVLARNQAPGTVGDVISGIELLRVLASSDVLGRDALRQLPEAVVEGGQAMFADGIRIGPIEIEGQAITRALGLAAAEVAWAFEVVDGKVCAGDLERVPFDVRERVSLLGTARVSSTGGEAQVAWKTIETETGRLIAAREILRALARGPSLGAFR